MTVEKWEKILKSKEVQEAINAADIHDLVEILRLGFDFSDYDISDIYTTLQSIDIKNMPTRSQVIGQQAFEEFCKGLEAVAYAGGATWGHMDQEEYEELLAHDGEVVTIREANALLYAQRDRFSVNFIDSYWDIIADDNTVIRDVSGRALRLIALAPE